MNNAPVKVELQGDAPVAAKLPRQGWLYAITSVVALGAAVSLLVVVCSLPTLPDRWSLQLAVFVAVATVPHWLVEAFAWAAVALGKDLQPGDHKIGFTNPGAYLGVVERILFLGALVAGYPEFIAVWFVFKGIADYRVGLPEVRARRTFQLFLLNNAVSLAGVALAWLVWNLLDLPTF
jgi:hypothetical protein